jgi:hypothetical protein
MPQHFSEPTSRVDLKAAPISPVDVSDIAARARTIAAAVSVLHQTPIVPAEFWSLQAAPGCRETVIGQLEAALAKLRAIVAGKPRG